MSFTFLDNTEPSYKQIKKEIDKGLTEGAIYAEGNCIIRCPVDTGKLRGSISYKTNISQLGQLEGSAKSGDAYIGTNVEYAPHVEYGTVKQPAQAFLRTGIAESKEGIMKIISNRLKNHQIKGED